LRNCKS